MTKRRSEAGGFEDPANDLTELQVDQLAAIHAALNDDAAGWQQDVILNAVIEILTGGDYTCGELAAALNTMWVTQAITEVAVDRALADGRELELVVPNTSLGGRTKWTATAGARSDVEKNHLWAERVFGTFQKQMVERLADEGVELKPERYKRVAAQVLQALAVGAAGTFEVLAPGTSRLLRPVNFDRRAAERWLETKVEPASVRDGCKILVMASLNPLDEFGSEVVHLLVMGNLLRGVMTRQDVPDPVDLGGTRLLLDTSVLVDLIDEDTNAQHQLLQVVALTQRLGGVVVVAEQTMEEWARLWDAADREQPRQLEAAALAAHADLLVRNKLVQIFIRVRSKDQSVNWPRFEVGRRDLAARLNELGIVARPSGNNTPADQDLEGRAAAEIRKVDEERESRGRQRRHTAVAADATSLAMIARWRLQAPQHPAAGYFCARDTLTGKAFGRLFPTDMAPLTVNPEGWLLCMARLVTGDPAEKRRLVEVVGSNVVSETFFGMATGYSVEDALHVSNIMNEDGSLSPRDLQTMVQLDFEGAMEGPSDDLARSRAEEALRRRSSRRDERALRLEAASIDDSQRAAEREKAADDQVREAERRREQDVTRVTADLDRVHAKELAGLDRKMKKSQRKARATLRWVITVACTVICIGTVTVFWMTAGRPSGGWPALHLFGVLGVFLLGADAALHPEKPTWELFLAAGWGVVFTVLGAALG